jgi:hypothetical protein
MSQAESTFITSLFWSARLALLLRARNLLAKRESFGRLKPALPPMVAAIANISLGK